MTSKLQQYSICIRLPQILLHFHHECFTDAIRGTAGVAEIIPFLQEVKVLKTCHTIIPFVIMQLEICTFVVNHLFNMVELAISICQHDDC